MAGTVDGNAVLHGGAGFGQRRQHLVDGAVGDQHRLGLGIRQHIGVVGGTHEGVGRDHDRADTHRAKEPEIEGRTILREQHDPVARPYAGERSTFAIRHKPACSWAKVSAQVRPRAKALSPRPSCR